MTYRVSEASISINGVLIDYIPNTLNYSLYNLSESLYYINFQCYNTVDNIINASQWKSLQNTIQIDFNIPDKPISILFSQCYLSISQIGFGEEGRINIQFKGNLI